MNGSLVQRFALLTISNLSCPSNMFHVFYGVVNARMWDENTVYVLCVEMTFPEFHMDDLSFYIFLQNLLMNEFNALSSK